ncbi:MAG: site-specific DNA-methyltransferase [Candidatus Aenigmarchaeota archaeon]|nr:site-specific DNA-methyltransferase [Candidatus Aenigmarchaeota archaeon]
MENELLPTNEEPIKIINGDCLEVLKKLPDGCVDLVLTDPPYGINFIPQRKESKIRLGDTAIINDEIQGEDWVKWFMPICKECFRVLKNGGVAYFFSGFNPYYYYCLMNCGFEIKANLIWVKNNFGLGYHFRRQYEQVLVGFKGNVPIPKKAMSDVIFEKKVRGIALLHSCQKPERLIRLLIKQYSKEGDIVIDPFVGSGTTAITCKQLGRKCIGIELDKKYYNTIVNRLKQGVL